MWENNIFFHMISRSCLTTARAQAVKQIPRFLLYAKKRVRDLYSYYKSGNNEVSTTAAPNNAHVHASKSFLILLGMIDRKCEGIIFFHLWLLSSCTNPIQSYTLIPPFVGTITYLGGVWLHPAKI
jgi:hypothetical protein